MTTNAKMVRIVFIDDYKLVRIGISAYLDSLDNFEVTAQAETAEEGLAQIDRIKPDVVLMDLGLPKMNGIEATRIVKEKHPDIKVIVLTSHENEESVIAALGAGANAYCLKDIAPERLVEVIHSVLDGAAWLDPMIANIALNVFSQASVKNNHPSEEISLGEREREVLRLLTLGKNNNEIAEQLFVSVHTVKSQVSTILQKLSVNDRVQAAVKAVTTGLVSLDE